MMKKQDRLRIFSVINKFEPGYNKLYDKSESC